MKPQKQCNHAGCKNLVDYTERYCSNHKNIEKRKSNYDSYTNRKLVGGKYFKFYHSKEWTKLSQLYRYKNPLCEQCLKEKIYKKADVVDHIIEIRDDWSKRYDETNLQSLCHFHHNAKTRRERSRRVSR